jgi:lipopolysaccharide transport system ATP-binding protein
MPSDDIAISVRNLTKTYRLFAHQGDRIKQAFTFCLRQYHKEFTALKDVSFDIRIGETVGMATLNGKARKPWLG